MNNELKQIKKIYGEEMMHLCREMFPGILEKEGLLLKILQTTLAETHSFASDIKEHNLYEEFKDWIYSFIDVKKDNLVITNKTPFELMDEAGYILYECKTEEDIQSFRKYYARNEMLCTIYNGGRLNRCHVFFAVKKNVDEIKRENFTNPQREDEYGTSVISIQFSRGKINDLSIKNRYNHTVNQPDATFSNNLENIIPGLTKSFEKCYGLNIYQNINRKSNFIHNELQYKRANDGKYYRYNLETDGIYYCENNVIIKDGEVIIEYANNKERYIVIDKYVIDRKDKKIYNLFNKYDSFVRSINDVGQIQNIEVTRNGENRVISINYIDGKCIKIEINKNNAIIGYENNYVTKIRKKFLPYITELRSISLSRAQTIEDSFLRYNQKLREILLPQVQIIGEYFLVNNRQLKSISLPQVQTIGNQFLFCNKILSSISLPQVQTIEDCFLFHNEQLREISLPQVKRISDCFLSNNEQLNSISLPEVQYIGNDFLTHNKELTLLSFPNLRYISEDNSYARRKKILEDSKNNEEVNNQRSK